MSRDESSPHDLGSGEIDPDDGTVSLPEAVLDAEVLSTGADAHWAYEPETERIVVTRSRHAFEEGAGYNLVDTTDVSDDGALELPDEFLDGGDESPWSGYLRGEERCYFDTSVDMLAEALSYALPEEPHAAFWND